MNSTVPTQFTHSHESHADGGFSFGCASDPERWPWLALAPFDPIVVQTINYYAAYESAVARGHYKSGQWTALTSTDWRCGESDVEHAVRGVIHPPSSDSLASYKMSFFDRQDALVYTMSGDGVVFKNRNFEAWRSEQRKAMPEPTAEQEFDFVPAAAMGLKTQVESFLANPVDGVSHETWALVGASNGFMPEHPYHSGSGDHVNASHLADTARQFLRFSRSMPDLVIVGGEMQFDRYVELNQPFHLTLSDVSLGTRVLIAQGGNNCATITLHTSHSRCDSPGTK